MTTSTHTYTATVGGLPLAVRGGSLSLDAGRAPHVQGQLEVAFPDAWGTDGPNLVAGSDFEDPALVPWDISAADFVLSTISPYQGLRRLAITSNVTSTKVAQSLSYFPVSEGQVYTISLWASRSASFDGTTVNSKLSVRDAATGSLLAKVPYALANLPTGGVWTQRTGTFTVPAGVTSVYFDLRADHTAGQVNLDAIEIRRRAVYDLLLDPRTSPPTRVTVTAQKDAGTVRTFNLHVRDRSVNYAAGTVTLVLASDEGLLEDYAPLADDWNPLAKTSLRAVVNYGLTQIGTATLEASPAVDADVTPYWAATNLITNPCAATATTGWEAGPSGLATLTRVTGLTGAKRTTGLRATSTSTGYWDIRSEYVPVTPGQRYSLAADVRASTARTMRLIIGFYEDTTQIVEVYADVAVGTAFQTIDMSAIAPARANKARVFVRSLTGTSGQWHEATALILAASVVPVPYHDGNGGAGTGYTYAWSGAANASSSTRTPVKEVSPESLIWKAGVSVLDFLHPLVQAAGYRLVCDETRKWTLRNENYTAAGSLSLRHGVNVIDAGETISRDAGYWFDARTTRYTWTDADGIQQERTDSYALAIPYSRLSTLEVAAPYPGPGRSEYAVRRAQGVGREVTVDTVSDWTARAEMPVSVYLENAPAGIGKTQSITYDLSTDRMTTTTRTVDTPTGAVNLLAGTVNALTGTVNAL